MSAPHNAFRSPDPKASIRLRGLPQLWFLKNAGRTTAHSRARVTNLHGLTHARSPPWHHRRVHHHEQPSPTSHRFAFFQARAAQRTSWEVTHLVDAERAPRRSSAIVQGAWRSNISSGVSIVLQARPAFLRALRRCCSSAYRAVLQGRLSDPWEAFSPIIATATDQPN